MVVVVVVAYFDGYTVLRNVILTFMRHKGEQTSVYFLYPSLQSNGRLIQNVSKTGHLATVNYQKVQSIPQSTVPACLRYYIIFTSSFVANLLQHMMTKEI